MSSLSDKLKLKKIIVAATLNLYTDYEKKRQQKVSRRK
jgi:hypothetical protein